MENKELLAQVTEKAQMWLGEGYDEETKAEVRRMLDADDKTELIESFYKDLEFGTGGLRGIMGAGSNRMNIYTVGAATQGLANYLKEAFPDMPQISVVVGHDVRNNSRKFAEIVADIFSANGIKVYLFDTFRPTPELSFAIRELGCQSGVNITASHNPKEYNGYKAYWSVFRRWIKDQYRVKFQSFGVVHRQHHDAVSEDCFLQVAFDAVQIEG